MDRNDQILFGVFAVIVVGIGLTAIGWSHDKGTAAEWSAAVFTGAAVFSAIWTAGRAVKLENDRVLARARVFAFYITPVVIRIDNAAERALAYGERSNFGFEDAPQDNFDIYVLQQLSIPVEIPREVFADAWALKPDVARNCIRLDAFARQYQGIVESQVPRLRLMDGRQRGEYLAAISLSLSRLKSLSGRTRKELTKLNGDLPTAD
jgi:hypothetical protein